LDAALWKARGNEVFTQEEMRGDAEQVWKTQPACRVFLAGFTAIDTQSGWIFEQHAIPHYSTDVSALEPVYEEIERRGLGGKFALRLMRDVVGRDFVQPCSRTARDFWLFHRATPEQCARAALAVLSHEHST
jgi:hypothetical protein